MESMPKIIGTYLIIHSIFKNEMLFWFDLNIPILSNFSGFRHDSARVELHHKTVGYASETVRASKTRLVAACPLLSRFLAMLLYVCFTLSQHFLWELCGTPNWLNEASKKILRKQLNKSGLTRPHAHVWSPDI